MNTNGLKDHEVAPRVKLSRVQISRIRRGKTGTSVRAAMRLQELTGIRFTNFLLVPVPVKRRRRKAA
jgi:plasmid maintenance system antidote protein VapI